MEPYVLAVIVIVIVFSYAIYAIYKMKSNFENKGGNYSILYEFLPSWIRELMGK